MLNTSPNLHHLELFYHVAKAGGITAAARVIPYGIQQPAISGQISQLESELGVRLFQRRPFQLTPAGRELLSFVSPFFGSLPEVAGRISGKASRHLRLSAPSAVVRRHLPDVLASIRTVVPDLEVTLTECDQRASFRLLDAEEVDLAVAEIEGRVPAGMSSEMLMKMPLVLLLPPGVLMPKRGLRDLIGKAPLIRPPSDTVMARLFLKGMSRKKWQWPPRIEVNELESVHEYVAKGFGIGLTVCAPAIAFPKNTKAVPLPGFPEMGVAALWKGKANPLVESVVSGLRKRVPGKA